MSYFSRFKTNTDPIVFRCTVIDTETKEKVGDFIDYNGRIYPIMTEEVLEEFQQAMGLGKRIPVGSFCPVVRKNEGLEPGEILVSDAWVQDDCRVNTRFKKINKRPVEMSEATIRIALEMWVRGLDPHELHNKTYIDIEKYLCHEAMSHVLAGDTDNLSDKVQKERKLWTRLILEANPQE